MATVGSSIGSSELCVMKRDRPMLRGRDPDDNGKGLSAAVLSRPKGKGCGAVVSVLPCLTETGQL